MNSDLYLLVKRAHPSHGGYRIFIVAKLDTQFNWDVFHNEQFQGKFIPRLQNVSLNLLKQIWVIHRLFNR